MAVEARCTLWNELRHAGHVSVFVSHAVPDGPWAEWIALELGAAGHDVQVDVARPGFGRRVTGALPEALLVLLLISAEHHGADTEWAEIGQSPHAGGRLVVLRLDASLVPGPLRSLPCHSLHSLDEEEALDLLLRLAGGLRRHPGGPGGNPRV